MYRSLCLMIVVSLVVGILGCSDKPPRLHPPSIDASAAGSGAMDKYDKDGDGEVAGDELEAAPSLKAALENLDTDGDGAVSADEVTARVEAWQESRVGRTTMSCRVTRQGQSLEGAAVTFEPESFLGPEVKAAEGVTDSNGLAVLSIPGADPPGVAPGLYLVRISKEQNGQEMIPPKYNTETVLGQEVSQDAFGLEEGITYDLQF